MEQQFAEREAVEWVARLDDYAYADNRLALAKLLANGQVSVMDRKRRAAQSQLPEAKLKFVQRTTPAERVSVALGVKLPDDIMVRGKLKAAPADHEGHAQCVLTLYPGRFAWVSEWGWLHWDGRHWERTQKDASAVKLAIVETLRTRAAVAVEANDDYLLKACAADAHEVNGVLQMVQAMVVFRPEQFDCYPDHLNCQNGVVNLRTGELIEHDSGWRFTTMVDVAYKRGRVPELWRSYLWESIWDGTASEEENVEKITWIWQFCGYVLTGHIKEQIFVYLHGPPRSGKGLFTQTLQKLLGRPLSIETDMDMFTSVGADTNNFHLAPLSGARLVVASETEKHKRMNGAVVKSLSGGDSIYASYKGLTHFNFNPVFKILMSSNWPVNVDSEDDAVWARLRVVTFPTSRVGQEDKGLGAKLQSQEALEGLLSWCVSGAEAWYRGGQSLPYPKILKRTAEAMRGEQDIVGIWMDDACSVMEPGTEAVFTPTALLYKNYAGWCKDAGIRAKNRNSFMSALESQGYRRVKRAHDMFKTTGWGYHGLALSGDGDGLSTNQGAILF
jgi:putative DNA primase/helicase